uniref:Protein serine threonine n=1 Tax=Tetraselmis sp. GSL018 TaxID=582737 RepID=A0A061RBS7_9CHLO
MDSDSSGTSEFDEEENEGHCPAPYNLPQGHQSRNSHSRQGVELQLRTLSNTPYILRAVSKFKRMKGQAAKEYSPLSLEDNSRSQDELRKVVSAKMRRTAKTLLAGLTFLQTEFREKAKSQARAGPVRQRRSASMTGVTTRRLQPEVAASGAPRRQSDTAFMRRATYHEGPKPWQGSLSLQAAFSREWEQRPAAAVAGFQPRVEVPVAELTRLHCQAVSLLAALKAAKMLRRAAERRRAARGKAEWLRQRLFSQAASDPVQAQLCKAQNLLEDMQASNPGAGGPALMDHKQAAQLLATLRQWQNQRRAIASAVREVQGRETLCGQRADTVEYIWSIVRNVSSQIIRHAECIAGSIAESFSKFEDMQAPTQQQVIAVAKQVTELVAKEMELSRENPTDTSANPNGPAPLDHSEVAKWVLQTGAAALMAVFRVQSQLTTNGIEPGSASVVFKGVLSAWKASCKILEACRQVCGSDVFILEGYAIPLEAHILLTHDSVILCNQTFCREPWSPEVKEVLLLHHCLGNSLQSLSSMVTHMLGGVDELHENCPDILDELEAKADDVADGFYTLLGTIVERLEGMVAQQEECSAPQALQEFVCKVIDFVLDLFGDNLHMARCIEMERGNERLSSIITSSFACLRAVGRELPERAQDLDAHMGYVSEKALRVQGAAQELVDMGAGSQAPLMRASSSLSAPWHSMSFPREGMDRSLLSQDSLRIELVNGDTGISSPAASWHLTPKEASMLGITWGQQPLDPRNIAVTNDHHLELKRQLGHGSSGSVYLGKRRHEKGYIAVKVIPGLNRRENDTPEPEDKWSEILREWDTHYRLRGRYMVELEELVWYIKRKKGGVHLLGIEPGKEYLCFVMEFCCFGDLNQLLLKAREYRDSPETNMREEVKLSRQSEETVKFFKRADVRIIIAQHVAAGLRRMHARGIVHCDLRPTNIFLNEGNKEKHGHTMVAQIGDFGGSRFNAVSVDGNQPSNLLSIKYQAPEVIRDPGSYTAASDVFSFGVVLWQIITLEQPWEGMVDAYVWHHVPHGQRLKWPEGGCRPFYCYAEAKDLVCRCWDNEPSNRPNMEEVLECLQHLYEEEVMNLKQHLEHVKQQRAQIVAMGESSTRAQEVVHESPGLEMHPTRSEVCEMGEVSKADAVTDEATTLVCERPSIDGRTATELKSVCETCIDAFETARPELDSPCQSTHGEDQQFTSRKSRLKRFLRVLCCMPMPFG